MFSPRSAWFTPGLLAPLLAAVLGTLPLTGSAATWPTDKPPATTIGLTPSGIGSTVLWNGRDLEGWTVFLSDPKADPKGVWSVADGVLHLTGRPFGYLRSAKDYGNFHLHVEWRYPVGSAATSNSGVFVLVHGPNAIWPSGIECQLKAGEAGQMIGTNVTLPGAPFLRAKSRAPALHPPQEKPFGEWNAYDIFCRDQVVEVWVNSVLQNRFAGVTFGSDPGLKFLRGSILLQLEGAPIDFRNIWLEGLF
jgi:Domain of Unknown Function (DUF1080)